MGGGDDVVAREAKSMRRAVPRVSQILETSLYVDDLGRSRSFYEAVLGFVPMFQDDRMCAMEVPGEQVLLLFRHGMTDQPAPGPGGTTIPPHYGSGALHVAFAIPFGELAAWEEHLRTRGIVVESRVGWPAGGTSLYFRDPDGHALEVATPGLWPNR
jgi:catechol 2,3-dioxygenase-like lactoylglutathione lyase family enzyme